MPRPSSLACVRCGAHYPLDHYDRACAACAAQNIAANLTVCYDVAPGGGLTRGAVGVRPRSLWRWDAFLPATAADAVTLGEGDTPLIAVPGLGLGDVWIKDEFAQSDLVVQGSARFVRRDDGEESRRQAHRIELVRKRRSINGGLRGEGRLPCIVFTFKGAAGPLLTQMRAYGAMVLVVENKDDRWRLQSAGVEQFGWYSTSPFFGPVVGSNPLAWKATRRSPTRSPRRSTGSRRTGACCRSATATRCTACGRALRS